MFIEIDSSEVTAFDLVLPDDIQNYAQVNILIDVNTTTAAVTITLPSIPDFPAVNITVNDAAGTFNTNNVTVDGGTINGASSLVLTVDDGGALIKPGSTSKWVAFVTV